MSHLMSLIICVYFDCMQAGAGCVSYYVYVQHNRTQILGWISSHDVIVIIRIEGCTSFIQLQHFATLWRCINDNILHLKTAKGWLIRGVLLVHLSATMLLLLMQPFLKKLFALCQLPEASPIHAPLRPSISANLRGEDLGQDHSLAQSATYIYAHTQ